MHGGRHQARGRVPERFIGLVLKTGVPSAQPPEIPSTCENTPDDLGAFLGALAELLTDAPDLTALLAAWPALPEPVRAGIAAMVKAAIGTERPS
jgi:hypothetical protein